MSGMRRWPGRTGGALAALITTTACGGAPGSRGGVAPTATGARQLLSAPIAGWQVPSSPVVMPTEAAPPSASLLERVSASVVSVAPSQIGLGQTAEAKVWVVAAPDGGLRLAWNEEQDIHVRTFDAALAPVGDELLLPGHLLAALELAPDGGMFLGVIAFADDAGAGTSPNQLDLLRIGPDGALRWRTPVVGEAGRGPGLDWFQWTLRSAAIAVSDARVGVFVGINHDFGAPGAPDEHNGDLFVAVGLDDGVPIDGSREWWSSSHSALQHLVVGGRGQFLTLSIGDSHPVGLLATDRDSDTGGDVTGATRGILWPLPEVGATYAQMVSSTGVGTLGGAVWVDGRVFATLGTQARRYAADLYETADPMLISFDEQVGTVTRRWLIETPDADESYPFITRQAGGMLALWGTAPSLGSRLEWGAPAPTATLVQLDATGATVEGPVATGEPLPHIATPVQLTDGSVAWASAPTFRGSDVRVVKVRP